MDVRLLEPKFCSTRSETRSNSIMMLWDSWKPDWHERMISALLINAYNCWKKIRSNSLYKKRGREIGWKEEEEEGSRFLGIGITIDYF